MCAAMVAAADASETPSKRRRVADSTFKLFKGTGSQNDAFAYGEERGWSCFVAHGTKGGKAVTNRGVFESRAAFKQYLRERPEQKEQWCHLIRDGQQDRLRVDLEVYYEASVGLDECKQRGKEIQDELVAAIQDHFFEGDGATLRLHVFDRTREVPEGHKKGRFKYSIHLIWDAYFDTTAHQKQAWQEFARKHGDVGHERVQQELRLERDEAHTELGGLRV